MEKTYNDYPYFFQVEPLFPPTLIATANETVMIDTLMTCQSYWVTITAINCASRIQSQPELIGLQDPRTFEATLSLPTGVTCSDWIADNSAVKINSLEDTIRSTLNGDICRQPSVRCTVGSQFTCGGDQTKATFS